MFHSHLAGRGHLTQGRVGRAPGAHRRRWLRCRPRIALKASCFSGSSHDKVGHQAGHIEGQQRDSGACGSGAGQVPCGRDG